MFIRYASHSDSTSVSPNTLLQGKYVMLYFSAHW